MLAVTVGPEACFWFCATASARDPLRVYSALKRDVVDAGDFLDISAPRGSTVVFRQAILSGTHRLRPVYERAHIHTYAM